MKPVPTETIPPSAWVGAMVALQNYKQAGAELCQAQVKLKILVDWQ